MIEADLVDRLKSDTTVGSLISGRIHPGKVPSKDPKKIDRPLIVWKLKGDAPDLHTAGGNSRHKLRIEFGCQSTTYLEAKRLAEAVQDCLMPDRLNCPGLVGSTWIEFTQPEIQSSDHDHVAEDLGYHQIPVEVEIDFVK